jgi:predicted component of type VI protein secretion system
LFEPLTNLTATLIENEIKRMITNYEPRATIDTVSVSSLPDQNQFAAFISVYIANQTSPTAINLILQRTR